MANLTIRFMKRVLRSNPGWYGVDCVKTIQLIGRKYTDLHSCGENQEMYYIRKKNPWGICWVVKTTNRYGEHWDYCTDSKHVSDKPEILPSFTFITVSK